MDLTEAEDIKNRWQEYTEELYKKDLHDPDNQSYIGTIIANYRSCTAGILLNVYLQNCYETVVLGDPLCKFFPNQN